MSHLSPAEFVDLVEATLPAARAAHAETCEACRAQAVALHTVRRDAAAIDVPEPSPLFWEAFSARVSRAVTGVNPGRGWRDRVGAGWVATAAAAVLVIALAAGARLARDAAAPADDAGLPAASAPRDVPAAAIDDTLDAANAEVWDVLVAVASDMESGEAGEAGMAVHPDAIDHAVQRMSSAELSALARLLRSELKGSGD